MAACMREGYANPSSITAHYTGANKYRREAAAAMAALLNTEPENFVFTSGATESNNWIFGPIAENCDGRTILISAIEHPSVTEPAMALRKRGFNVIEVPVDTQGVLKPDALEASLSEGVAIVSIMSANNETGVIQPIRKVGEIIRSKAPKALFHVDGTQSVGKVPIDLSNEFDEVDLFSFSAHKFHGPKGIGGLFIRDGIVVNPMVLGGGQELGYRSGTVNSPALAGLTVAAREALTNDPEELAYMRDEFEQILLTIWPNTILFSEKSDRLPNTSMFSICPGNGTDLVDALAQHECIVSAGSACSSGTTTPAKTLLAMGVEYDVALGGIRLSVSILTQKREIKLFLRSLKSSI